MIFGKHLFIFVTSSIYHLFLIKGQVFANLDVPHIQLAILLIETIVVILDKAIDYFENGSEF